MTDQLCTCGHPMKWHLQLCSTRGCDCSAPRPTAGSVTIPAVMTHRPWPGNATDPARDVIR